MSTLVSEIQDGLSALQTFYQNRANYILSGGTPENHEAIGANLNFENLQTYSVDSSPSGRGFTVGLSSEIISEYSATVRELGMASQAKSDIYLSIASEATDEVTNYSQNSTYNVAVMRGAPTNGPQV